MPRVTQPRELPTTADALVRVFPPMAIQDEIGYRNAMEMIDSLTNLPRRSTGQETYLETLSILVAAYEEQEHSFETQGIGPLEVLRHLMEEHHMTASDLGRILGERSLGPKVLNGDRSLSKSHILKLSDYFNVPTDLFMR